MFPSFKNLIKAEISMVKVIMNESDIDLKRENLELPTNRDKFLDGWIRRCYVKALLYMESHDLSKAQEWIEDAIQDNKKNGNLFELAQDHALYAELCKQKGEISRARENAHKAIEIYKECGSDGWVEIAETKLAELG